MYMHGFISKDEGREVVLKNISTCLITKGYSRSVIIDTQRGDYRIVPNSLVEFMNEMEYKTKADIYSSFAQNSNESSIVDEYLNYIEEMDFSFWCPKDVVHNFPAISLEWDCPSTIQNAIVFINKDTDVPLIVSQLEELNCFHLQLRISYYLNILDLDVLLKHFEHSITTSIELHLEYFEVKVNDIAQILNTHLRVHSIVFFKSPEEIVYQLNEYQHIIFSSEDVNRIDIGSKKSIEQFNPNLTFYMESLFYNPYFNRKLCIDKDGNIRNSSELPWSYGNIGDTKIKEAINSKELQSVFFEKDTRTEIDFAIDKPAFNSLWYVNKQLIDICKDCEFKNMCFDNRCPLQRKDGSWYYSSECNYNPYICKWEGEDGYKTLAECGVMVNENTFQKDDEVIMEINKNLWKE